MAHGLHSELPAELCLWERRAGGSLLEKGHAGHLQKAFQPCKAGSVLSTAASK